MWKRKCFYRINMIKFFIHPYWNAYLSWFVMAYVFFKTLCKTRNVKWSCRNTHRFEQKQNNLKWYVRKFPVDKTVYKASPLRAYIRVACKRLFGSACGFPLLLTPAFAYLFQPLVLICLTCYIYSCGFRLSSKFFSLNHVKYIGRIALGSIK